jgi:hypothetical protein
MSLISRPQSQERDYIKASRRNFHRLRCAVCGQVIEGKAWRVSQKPERFACTFCNNQRPGQ